MLANGEKLRKLKQLSLSTCIMKYLDNNKINVKNIVNVIPLIKLKWRVKTTV